VICYWGFKCNRKRDMALRSTSSSGPSLLSNIKFQDLPKML